MKYTKKNIKNSQKIIINIMEWILFGFLFVALPATLRVWYESTIGYNLVYSDCIQDVCLAVLAICCNFINLCIDMENHILYLLRWIFGIVFGIICIICLFIYLLIEIDDKTVTYFNKNINISNKVFEISAIIIGFILIIGIVIIFHTIKEKEKYKLIKLGGYNEE